MKRPGILFLLVWLVVALPVCGNTLPLQVHKTTVVYAQKDTSTLKMDIYRQVGTETVKQPVMLFLFGGSFKRGNRDAEAYIPYFNALAEKGITTVSIDYRLGLAGKRLGLFHTSPADSAINMAVEDLFSATRYIMEHAGALKIDTTCILISGSSAGAVTCLQADYYLKNRMPLSEMLPADFTYSGVIAFAGAIYSHKGIPDYAEPASPTFFIHGNKDRVVFYNRLRFFRKGLFGSRSLAKRFEKRGFSYFFLTMDGEGHSVAVTAMTQQLEYLFWFIDYYIYEGKRGQMDSRLRIRKRE